MCGENKKCSCKCNKNKINESVLLQEKVNLKLNENSKTELLKQSKIAIESYMSMYNLCEKENINNKKVLDLLDEAYAKTNEMLTLFVVQNTKTNLKNA